MIRYLFSSCSFYVEPSEGKYCYQWESHDQRSDFIWFFCSFWGQYYYSGSNQVFDSEIIHRDRVNRVIIELIDIDSYGVPQIHLVQILTPFGLIHPSIRDITLSFIVSITVILFERRLLIYTNFPSGLTTIPWGACPPV